MSGWNGRWTSRGGFLAGTLKWQSSPTKFWSPDPDTFPLRVESPTGTPTGVIGGTASDAFQPAEAITGTVALPATGYIPLAQLPLGNNTAQWGDWLHANEVVVRDVGGAHDLFTLATPGASNGQLRMFTSQNEGYTWKQVPDIGYAAVMPSGTDAGIAGLAQDSTGNIHMVYRRTSSAGYGYYRMTPLRDAEGHLIGYTNITTMIDMEVLGTFGGDRRCSVGVFFTASGTEVVGVLNICSDSATGFILQGWFSVASNITPTVAADFKNQAGTATSSDLVYQDANLGQLGGAHDHTVEFAQLGSNRDLYFFGGNLAADAAPTLPLTTQWVRLTASGSTWSIGTINTGTFGAGVAGTNGSYMLGVCGTTNYVWVMLGNYLNGQIRIGRINSSGTYEEPIASIPAPVVDGRSSQTMFGYFNVSSDETRIWTMFTRDPGTNPTPQWYDFVITTAFWNGIAWTVYATDTSKHGDNASLASANGFAGLSDPNFNGAVGLQSRTPGGGNFRGTLYVTTLRGGAVGSSLTALSWQSEFPDLVPRGIPQAPVGYVISTVAPIVAAALPALTWQPVYPSLIPARARPVNVGIEVVEPFQAALTPALTPLSWQGQTIGPTPRTAPVMHDAFSYVPAIQRWGLYGGGLPWLPTYPDSARGPARPAPEGWFTLVEPPASIRPFAFAWEPYYPDLIARKTGGLNTGGLFWTNVEREPSTDWAPEFPDLVPGRPPVNVGPSTVYPLQPPVVVSADIKWLPSYPDFARGAPRPVDVGQSVLVIQEREPAVDWLPSFPDFARGPARPVGEGQSVLLEPPVSIRPFALGWLPAFPDFARGALRALNTGGLFWTNLEREPQLDWSPEFPDFAPGRKPNASEGWNALVIQEREPTTDWAPEFPDFAPGPRRNPEGGLSQVQLVGIAPPAPLESWLPTYPDFARAPARPVNEGGSAPQPATIIRNPAPLGSWYPSFPDTARGPTPINVGPALAQTLLNFIAPPAPALSWGPEFPDFAPGPRRPVAEGGQAVEPPTIIRNPAPLGSWAPSYPDFARGLPPLTHGGVTQTLLSGLAPPAPLLSWSPTFPDFARGAPRSPDVGWFATSYRAAFPPAPLGSWAPTYPDFARGPKPVNVGPAVAQLLLSFIAAPAPALSWEPEYPDFPARGPKPPVNEGGRAVEPLLSDYAPKLSWEPTFPDFPARGPLRPVNEGGRAFAPAMTIGKPSPPLAWAPTYPDFARGPTPLVNEGLFSPHPLDVFGSGLHFTRVTRVTGVILSPTTVVGVARVGTQVTGEARVSTDIAVYILEEP